MLRRKNLHKYQKGGSRNIVKTPRSFLMADMGLGKTIMTLTAIQDVSSYERTKVILTAPPSVVEGVWQEEAENWKHIRVKVTPLLGTPKKREALLQDDSDIHVLSTSQLLWFGKTIEAWSYQKGYQWPYTWFVADESSQFRNISSTRGKIALKLSRIVKRVTLLSATPVPKDYTNLYQQIKLIDGGRRLGETASKYHERYFNVKRTIYGDRVSLKAGSKKRIHKTIRDVAFRYSAKKYLPHVPELLNNIIRCPMSNMARYYYQEMKTEYLIEVDGKIVEAVNDGVKHSKLQQIANGQVYDENKETIHIHDGKLKVLKELCGNVKAKGIDYGSLGERNILVVYTFGHDRDRIIEQVTGAQHFSGRKADKDAWNAEPDSGKRYVVHAASAGHGLNLQTGGSTLIFYGIDDDFELYDQIRGRLARQGQAEIVMAHHLVSEDTIDEQTYRKLLAREMEQQELLEAMHER